MDETDEKRRIIWVPVRHSLDESDPAQVRLALAAALYYYQLGYHLGSMAHRAYAEITYRGPEREVEMASLVLLRGLYPTDEAHRFLPCPEPIIEKRLSRKGKSEGEDLHETLTFLRECAAGVVQILHEDVFIFSARAVNWSQLATHVASRPIPPPSEEEWRKAPAIILYINPNGRLYSIEPGSLPQPTTIPLEFASA